MTMLKSFGRRSFLKMASLATAATATSAFANTGVLREAKEEEIKNPFPGSKLVKTVCSYCSVGCGVVAEVHNGVWVRQEVAYDHPISHGGHCCKGADMIDKARATNRLKYPMEKVNGEWKRVSWDNAMGKISDKLQQLREEHGPDAVQFIGSSKVSNEQAFYIRKFAAMFGTNNIDQQARICHSPTVAGVANTWGYGAMTNHIGDMQNSKAIIIFGANPASNHPVAMQHILKSKEQNGAKIIVVDPRYTKTAAKSDVFCRIRPGTDIAFMYGMIRIIKKNNWFDKQFLNDRVYGIEEIFKECEEYTPEHVEHITGCPKETLIQATSMFASADPGSLIWNQGLTQHTIGSSNTRLATIVQLILGNMGKTGGGCNILRGHDNVQGATDLGCLSHTLPGYYGLSEGSWKYFSKQWNVDYDWLKGRFKSKELMESEGFSLSLWLHGVLEQNNAKNNGGSPLRALVVIGNGISTITQTHKVKEALDKLELVVFVDPFVNDSAVMTTRENNLFMLPVATQMETSGSIVNTSRTIQWRYQVIDPLYEARPDHEILFDFAKRLGFYDQYVAGMGKGKDFKWPEDATNEIARSLKTIGMQGRTAERIKNHTDNWHLFDSVSLKGKGALSKEYYGLPWPCWNESHPGSPVLYNVNLPVSQGGMGFRARFGTERNGTNLLAEKGVAPVGSRIKGGYAEITYKNIEELAGVKLSAAEKKAVEGKNWKTDDSGILNKYALKAGLAPYGNAKARTIVWNFTDQIPKHREPLHSPRPDLVKQYPAIRDKKNYFRTDVRYESEQNAQEWSKDYPTSIVSGRIVEHFGSGTETRASKYLAELSPEMYGEVHPNYAASLGIKDGEMMWVYGTAEGKIKVRCKYSHTVAEGYVFLPQNFSGVFSGEKLDYRYPEGTQPYIYGEASNQITSYGFDQETGCPETKCSLVRLERA
ncbi:molybdopterin-dependent oxidoreductase [Candidatus Marinarcus aquaticus]|uniref:Formate dehydrogenase n=1 Tax=Candidatus Marinarcus aquaticus TaxID=2044504 RepID=A0A4Q0XUZ0_9BACT|nr:molybdopterin-dependent oxidoreductase [Candidatus Marinarcus aquaticus]RXJ60785.1 formate dehydrogenase [Candidatus Marinarcus aquaticus]